MQPRVLDFIVGVETSTQPNPGTPTDPADVVSLDYLQSFYGEKRVIVGSLASPVQQNPAVSIAHTLTDVQEEATIYLENANVGTGDMTAVAPPLAVPTKIGQRVSLYFTSDTTRILLSDNAALRMKNGDLTSLNNTQIEFEAISLTEWAEVSRDGVGDV